MTGQQSITHCADCGGAILPRNIPMSYGGPICYCAAKVFGDRPIYIHMKDNQVADLQKRVADLEDQLQHCSDSYQDLGKEWGESLSELEKENADLKAKLARNEKALEKCKEQRDSYIIGRDTIEGPITKSLKYDANKELEAILADNKTEGVE